jgi:ABC-type uncharacterized transport system ATPase subunit
MPDQEVVLQVEGITKRFPGVLANDSVNLELHRGEILALLGENGAGKSTLMNIIYGLYHADEGTIRVKGKEVRFASPREAIHSGIGMVHQHFQLIPVLTVAENVILGEEETVTTRSVRKAVPAEETALAGTIRLVWGALWRALGPLVAAGIGLLVGQVMLLLTLVIATHLAQGPQFETFAYERMDLMPKAEMALVAFYPQHTTATTFLLWLPLAAAALVGAASVVLGYRYARRTWRGRARIGPNLSRVDTIIDAVIDLFSTMTAVQDQKRADRRVRELSKQYGLEVDPDAVVEELPVGMQQRVEIIKALYRHADILILDEPTAVLTPQESRELFKIMKELAAQGVSIIFITHKLKEVFAVADSIVVMRDGKVVGTTKPAEATEASLAAMMVGRSVILKVAKSPATPGDVVLSVKDLTAKDDRGALVLDGVSFEVRAGEVLGIAGVQGNGQTELVEVLTGLRKPLSGHIRVDGQRFDHAAPREITMAGVAHVPEDRQRYGMVKPFSVADNLVLNQYYVAPFSTAPSWRQLPFALIAYAFLFSVVFLAGVWLWSGSIWPALQDGLKLAELDAKTDVGPFILALLITVGATFLAMAVSHLAASTVLNLVQRSLSARSRNAQGGLTVNSVAVTRHAAELVREFDIRTPSVQINSGNLSGGNQQKMVVAREFHRKPRLLIASQPTRGIDVGSIEFIHQRIIQQRDEGAAVLLVSAELDEIMALSDRIAVMYKGQIIDTLPAATATREELGLLMAGVKGEAAQAVPA